jgi:alpha-galactosidase
VTPSRRSRPLPRLLGAALLILTAGLLLGGVFQRPAPAAALINGVALTPPMGWNSWYGFYCAVDETTVEQMADALVSTGMRDAGYTYVNVDDCWQGSRASDGTITADPARFPDGMQAVVAYVHSRGLKFGLYTDAGSATCQGLPGSLGYEQQDADTYASWGVDFVKVDWCNSDGLDPPAQYNKMRDALGAAAANTGRPMVFSICDWGVDSPWSWGPRTGNMWRTTQDTGGSDNQWSMVLSAVDQNGAHAAVARPGAWNDPDALEAGLGSMSPDEERSQFTLWAMMAAPLLVSTDLRSTSGETLAMLMNPDVIAVDQDQAGVQGNAVKQDAGGQLQVWAKRLATKGTWAVALFNRSDSDAPITFDWSDIGMKSGRATVKDLWAGAPVPTLAHGYSAIVPGHGTVLLKVTSGDPKLEH